MTDDAIWDGFARAVVRIELPAGPVVLVPRRSGAGVFPFAAPVHIVTAYNPAGLDADAAVNQRRHRDLTRRVARHEVVETVGSAPDGSMPEPGFALLEISLAAAVEIGREFGQRAIYRWTPESLCIVGVDEPVERHLGWSISPVGHAPSSRET